MEDLYVSTGNYVQNAQGQIVQFLYGNDCMDGCQLEKQSTNMGTCSQEEFEQQYMLSVEDLKQSVIKRFVPTKEDFQQRELSILTKLREEIRGEYYFVPFNVERIIASVKNEHSVPNKKTQMSSDWVVDQLTNFFETVRINKILGSLKDHLLTYSKYIIWSKLASKKVIVQHKLNKKCFKMILEQIKEKIETGFVQSGEMVGPIAAQSIGEKLTQCVLDSFHSSGIASKTQMSGGVQRFQEIIHVSKKPNNPALFISLKDEYKQNKQGIKKIQEQLQYSNLEFFLKSFSVYYDPDFTATEDTELIAHHRKWFPEELGESPWVIVLEIDPAKLFQRKIDMEELVACLDSFADDKKMSIISSDHNAKTLKIHLRPLEHTIEDHDNLMSYQATLLDMTICGVQGIIESEIIKDSIGAISQGSQLREIMSMPWTDTYNTTSTNIHEILEIFGIEATRQLIIQEVYKFLEQNGVYVNERHIDLLADFITNQGILIALDRHGIAKSHHSVLTAGSFETVVPFLSKAGIFADRDDLNGVSPNIILGQIGKFGTGLSSILMD